jgi:hypothetical protein
LVALLVSLSLAVILPLRARSNGALERNLEAREESAFTWHAAVLNWSTVLVAAAISALLILAARWIRRFEFPPFGSVFLAALIGITWRKTLGIGGLAASPRTTVFLAVGLIALTIGASLFARSLNGRSADFAD